MTAKPLDPAELRDADRPRDALTKNVERYNADHAVIVVGDGPVVLQEYDDAEGEPTFRLLSLRGFREVHRPEYLQVGETRKSTAAWWLDDARRRTYQGLTFAPGRETPTWYNFWRGFPIAPDPAPCPELRCRRFLDHVAENLCQGDEKLFAWVMGWFAHIVQRPAEKLGTALVLLGGQGTGKTIVGEAVGSLLRPHYRVVSEVGRVTGRFNSHLANCLLLYLDEATWGGDHAAAGRLKDLITGQDLLIEYKGKEPIRVRNYVRLLITSNNHWVIPAGLDERRFAVLRMAEDRKQDSAYFGAIQAELEAGGRAALFAYLQRYDLSSVNLRQVPTTAALLDQQIASLPSLPQWWLDVLMRGALPGDAAGAGRTATDALYTAYVEHAKTVGVSRRAIETEVALYLRQHVPGLTQDRAVTHAADGSTSRVRQFVFPPLPLCRRAFAKQFGAHTGVLSWDDPSADWAPDASAFVKPMLRRA
jgi:hypothetical protein